MTTNAAVLATPVPGLDPLEPIAGVRAALRAVLTLQKEGIERVALVVAPDDGRTGERVTGDPRVRIPVEVIAATSRSEGLSRACEAGVPLLVAAIEVAADPGLYRDLAAASLGEALAALACRDGEALGPMLVSSALGEALEGRGGEALEEAVAGLRAEGRAAIVEIRGRWAFRVDSLDGRRRAITALFEACRKPVDGVISRHLNRHISIFISKQIVETRVTPNVMSVLTFALAIGAAFAVARGGYGAMLLGAALLQANSILDGVDGELARVRFQHSKTGQWLDTVSDDLSTLIFFAGLTVGVAGERFGSELALCGYGAMAALALAMAQNYAELLRIGSGDFYALDFNLTGGEAGGGVATHAWARIVGLFTVLLKKDFFIFLYLALAAIGLLPLALVIGLFGHVVALGATTARTVRRLVA